MKLLFEVALGSGPTTHAWSPNGQYLAVSGTALRLQIFDRHGALHDEIPLAGTELKTHAAATHLAWDARGEKLCVLHREHGRKDAFAADAATVYRPRQREALKLDNGDAKNEFTHCAWDPGGQTLALGTGKGNVLLYDSRTGKMTSVLGKHTKQITCGAWSVDNRLVLGSTDRSVTVSAAAGDTELQLELRGDARELCFAPEPPFETLRASSASTRTNALNQFSVNVGGRTLFVYRMGEDDKEYGSAQARSAAKLGRDLPPVELQFDERYGRVACHLWLGDGLLLAAFEHGHLVVMRVGASDEPSDELFVYKAFETPAVVTPGTPPPRLALCARAGKRLAATHGGAVKVFDVARDGGLREIPEMGFVFESDALVTQVDWALEGQVLAVSANDGVARAFLATLPRLADADGARCVFLSSLTEVSVLDLHRGPAFGEPEPVETIAVRLECEPSFVALGEAHVAAGANNQAWFFRVGRAGEARDARQQPPLVNRREYLGAVDAVAVSASYAIALCEGRAFVHAVEAADDPDEAREFKVPERGEEARQGAVTAVAATPAVAVYGTARGFVRLVSVRDRAPVAEHRHVDGAVAAVYPNASGTKVVFVDEHATASMYDPASERVLPIPNEAGGSIAAVLWDAADPDVFAVADSGSFRVYVYARVTVDGPRVEFVGAHARPAGTTPVSLVNGVVAWQTPASVVASGTLATHVAVLDTSDAWKRSEEAARERFARAIALNKLQVAWEVASRLRSPEMWERLAHRAMTRMEIEFAARVYRSVGDASMVMSLERLEHVEDTDELAAHVLVLFERDECYDRAQELFVRAGKPKEALRMRRDLKHWDEAARLAEAHQPEALDDICREHASALEARGEVDAALAMFARAAEFPRQSAAELRRSRAGVARCAIRAGDARRGARVALELDDAATSRECALLLEHLAGHHSDAARLFERAGAFEEAASVYVAQRQFDLAKPLMDRAASAGPKATSLRLRYAAAKEEEGAFAEAAESYELARDFDAAVRLRLSDRMRDPERAFAICRASRSQEACATAAAYCRAAGDAKRALEFLALARRGAEAFALARETGHVETLALFLGDDGVPEDYRQLASAFEHDGSFAKAADAHRRAGRLEHAVRCYLKAGDDDAVGAAVAVAGEARDDALTAQVVDFLSSASSAPDAGHSAWLFKLHVALGDYDAAAKTSGVIAQQEQEMGNYKLAHAQLLASHVELMKERKSVPAGLARQLVLLHSYVLVKSLVKRNDHDGAARLLRRVAANISKFPAHVVPILTSAVVECARAGLKKTSLDLAQRLMAPALRPNIGDAYKRKIETIARKPDPNAVDAPEPGSPCPFCDAPGGAYEMTCEVCRADLPCCVASGRRVARGEWSRCPACRFPCNAGAFKAAVAAEDGECPMCRARVDVDALEPASAARREGMIR